MVVMGHSQVWKGVLELPCIDPGVWQSCEQRGPCCSAAVLGMAWCWCEEVSLCCQAKALCEQAGSHHHVATLEP